MARARLLDPSPAAVERLERAAASALRVADWKRAGMLVAYRQALSGLLRDLPDQLTFLASLAANIDIAQERGWGPDFGEGTNETPVQP